MKLVKRPGPLFKGERAAAMDPPFATHISDRWNRRINYYAGRTLTHTALNVEQRNYSSRLRLYGGQLSPGVVHGLTLDLALDTDPTGEGEVDPTPREVLIQPGAGIDHAGEDVGLSQAIRVDTRRLPVVGNLPGEEDAPAGLGVIVLQAIVAESVADFDAQDPCEWELANDGLDDLQVVDGLRLAWYPWPTAWPQPVSSTPERIRNRAAYIIYERERQLDGGLLPWESSWRASGSS